MHCNLRPPEPRQPFPELITTPFQVWRRWSLLPYYSVSAADTLLYAVTLTFDPGTLTYDLWPWTFAAYRLWRIETLYQIWTQSNNPRWSYCDFSVWLCDLETVLSVALGSEIIFTKFDLRQLIRAWIIAFLMLVRYVKLWPDLWPVDLESSWYIKRRVIKVCTKFERNRAIPGWKFLHALCQAVISTFDLLALNFYSTSGVMRLNSVQNLSEI